EIITLQITKNQHNDTIFPYTTLFRSYTLLNKIFIIKVKELVHMIKQEKGGVIVKTNFSTEICRKFLSDSGASQTFLSLANRYNCFRDSTENFFTHTFFTDQIAYHNDSFEAQQLLCRRDIPFCPAYFKMP